MNSTVFSDTLQRADQSLGGIHGAVSLFNARLNALHHLRGKLFFPAIYSCVRVEGGQI